MRPTSKDFRVPDTRKNQIQTQFSNNASQHVQPRKGDKYLCTIMSLENLVKPTWISVSCEDKIVSDIICVNEHTLIHTGFHHKSEVRSVNKVNLTLFLCYSGVSFSSSRQCNGINDCGDSSDEENCFCFVQRIKVTNSYYCKHFCEYPKCVCHNLLYQGYKSGCHIMEQVINLDTIGGKVYTKEQYVQCPNEMKWIHEERMNDLIPDCHSNADEPILYSLLTENSAYVSPNLTKKEKSCTMGHPLKYLASEQCIYELDEKALLKTCRNGKHLENCKDFHCKNISKYKCPGYYCIPMRYVCNGRVDCPKALDEIGCENYTCERLFHCFNTSLCIYISNVCDSTGDCPNGDDEVNCLGSKSICPQSCMCLILAISCQITYKSFHFKPTALEYMTKIFITGNSFISHFTWFVYLSKVKWLHVHHFKLTDACNVFDQSLNTYSSLVQMDISNNQVRFLRTNCLQAQVNMLAFNVSKNTISKIEELTFINQRKLFVLDISDNEIASIKREVFHGLDNLTYFIFYGNDLKIVDRTVFSHLTSLQLIMTNDYKMCCLKPNKNTLCTVNPILSNDCQSLYENSVVVTIMFGIGFISMVLNVSSFCIVSCQKSCFEIISKYLCVANFAGSTHLLLITTGGMYFKVSASLNNELPWKKNILCVIASVMFTFFQISSVAIILFLSSARLLITKYPLNSRFKQLPFTYFCLRCIFMIIFVTSISLTLIVVYSSHLHVLPNVLCIIFYDPVGGLFHQYSSLSMALLQSTASLALFILHFLLFITIHQSLKLFNNEGKSYSDRKMIPQLVLVVFCTSFSWISSAIVYFLSVYLKQFSTKLLLYAVISLIPFSSFVNPIYIIVVNIKLKRFFKKEII